MDSLNYTGDVKVMFRMKKIKIPFIQPELAVWCNAVRHSRQISRFCLLSIEDSNQALVSQQHLEHSDLKSPSTPGGWRDCLLYTSPSPRD